MARKLIDWEAVEVQYRAGIRSLKDIGNEFGVSDAAIIKRAKRDSWSRDLAAKIQAKAEAKVSAAMVSAEVSAQTKATEHAIIEANAQAIADAILAHRKDIRRNRGLANKMLAELEAQTDSPELFGQLAELMHSSDSDAPDKLNDLYRKVISLPSRIDSAKKLAETLRVTIALEREAFGMDKEQKAETGLSSESIGTLKKLKAALENAD